MKPERPLVTVVIPVKNGGARLKECLDAVLAQQAPFSFRVLCVDSGSTDGSLDLLRASSVTLLQVAPETFGHGRTRNQAIAATDTPYVAMLTQDAVPADDAWLAALVRPLEEDPTVAGVFGPHLPHPGCIPTEAYLLARHFRNFGETTTRFAIRPGMDGWEEYERNRAYYRFFSDNNAALRRSTWEDIPYRDVEFMEDQLWAADVLEAGWAKVYAPDAKVRHSHNYPPGTALRRAFDEARYFRAYCDPKEAWGVGRWMREASAASRRDLEQLRADAALSAAEKLRWAVPSVARNFFQAAGSWLGDRHELLPEPAIDLLSQHRGLRAGDEETRPPLLPLLKDLGAQSLDRHGKLKTGGLALRQTLHVLRSARTDGWAWSLIQMRREAERALAAEDTDSPWYEQPQYRLADAAAPVRLDTGTAVRRRAQGEPLVINWVIPPLGRGSGGHMTIFRMIHLLEQRGHRCRVYVIRGDASQPPMRMQALVHAWFKPIAAPVLHLHSEMAPADVTLATSWETAYVVRASAAAPVRAYFVQDFEPAFFPAGAQAQLAEDTYRFGFKAVCAGHWLETLVRERYGMEARSFRLGVDPAEYHPELHVRPDRRRVYAYVRPHTARRGFELVGLTLSRLHQEMPEVEIHLAGAELEPSDMPFPFVGHGILTPAALRALFSTCDVALCPSFTNYSLMPQELAACGCPVVEVDVESTRAAYPPGAVLLAQPTVEGLTAALVQLLTDEPRRLAQAEAGLAYARSVTWESAAAEVDVALRQFAGDADAAPPAQLTSA